MIFIHHTEKKKTYISAKWYVDSRASTHVCNDELSIPELLKENYRSAVHIGDGTAFLIIGERAVCATAVVEETCKEVFTESVLNIPKLASNHILAGYC